MATSGGPVGFGIVGKTGAAGIALVNGTPTIMTWTAPNDGQMHAVMFIGAKVVASQETGGAVTLNFTVDGNAETANVFGGGAAAQVQPMAINAATIGIRPVDPNTTVTLTQSSALTGGASTLFGNLYAA